MMLGAIARQCLISCWTNPNEVLEGDLSHIYRDETQVLQVSRYLLLR